MARPSRHCPGGGPGLIVGAGLGTDETGDFSGFGDTTDPATRAAMLTEGLQVIRAMWAGAAIQHTGPHYRVCLPATEPEPHRIPVWMASSTNHPKVLARAVGCDGIFPNPGDHELTPARRHPSRAGPRRADGRPFDVAVRGNASPAWGKT